MTALAAERLLFVVIDATGLDAKHDDLVAIAFAILDGNLTPLAPATEFAIAPPPGWRVRASTPALDRLHRLGLDRECDSAEAVTVAEADRRIAALIDEHCSERTPMLIWDAADLDRCWNIAETVSNPAQLSVDGYAAARAGFVSDWLAIELPEVTRRLHPDWIEFESVRRFLFRAMPHHSASLEIAVSSAEQPPLGRVSQLISRYATAREAIVQGLVKS